MVEIFLAAETFLADVDKTLHVLSAMYHWPCTIFLNKLLCQFRLEPQHQFIAANAHTHLTIHHKGNAPEHFHFFYIRSISKSFPYAVGQFLS